MLGAPSVVSQLFSPVRLLEPGFVSAMPAGAVHCISSIPANRHLRTETGSSARTVRKSPRCSRPFCSSLSIISRLLLSPGILPAPLEIKTSVASELRHLAHKTLPQGQKMYSRELSALWLSFCIFMWNQIHITFPGARGEVGICQAFTSYPARLALLANARGRRQRHSWKSHKPQWSSSLSFHQQRWKGPKVAVGEAHGAQRRCR